MECMERRESELTGEGAGSAGGSGRGRSPPTVLRSRPLASNVLGGFRVQTCRPPLRFLRRGRPFAGNVVRSRPLAGYVLRL